MLAAYIIRDGALAPYSERSNLSGAVWIDLIAPTPEEEGLVEAQLGLEVPTREEMLEIEPSSRIYVEGGTRFSTAVIVTNSDPGPSYLAAVTFILHGSTLITVRYDDPRPFALFCSRAAKAEAIGTTGEAVLAGLLDTIIDRLADILEKVGERLDNVSASVFAPSQGGVARHFQEDLRLLGYKADLTSKARDSLVSLARLLLFWSSANGGTSPEKGMKAEIKTMQRDVDALMHHADALIGKSQFLLDAVVGLVSIEQNNIIKIF